MGWKSVISRTWIIPLLLHSTSALPETCVIATISSLSWHIIGASLSEPHTSRNLVQWFMHEELWRKTGLQQTTTVWYSGSCTKNTINIRILPYKCWVLSFMSQRITNWVYWCSIFGTVVHVTVNNKLSLLILHIWYGWLLVSRRVMN